MLEKASNFISKATRLLLIVILSICSGIGMFRIVLFICMNSTIERHSVIIAATGGLFAFVVVMYMALFMKQKPKGENQDEET